MPRDEKDIPVNPDEFERVLKAHRGRRPFLPFVVRLKDGRQYLIDNPAITFDGGVVGFMSDTDGLIDFSFDEVDRFEIAAPEPQT